MIVAGRAGRGVGWRMIYAPVISIVAGDIVR
jgi:hypothetical protein